ncbi:DUF6270 domain-containing protein [Oerskovia merdavium]|uniref:Uncharacterized protein n=1 Tax=Oerskovia merdavium TaxID=2762227 RepID=A0ABR8TUU5_9CELL|nr:DUF6270 domain-containing protein [Oerskovia merdavium]MBD7979520.1 hypothetical protein [Oerskovia merdavium]
MTGQASSRIKTLVFGSCVSRDTFSHLEPQKFELVQYIARQSILSAISPPTTLDIDLTPLTSRFQRRMVRGSLEGNLLASLEDARPDLIIWDITDERTGVFEMSDRSYVTRMVELDQVGMTAKVARASLRHIQFGTSEHFSIWTSACNRLAQRLSNLNLLDKTILLAPPWAQFDNNSEETPQSYGLTANQANQLMEPYLEYVEELLGRARITHPSPRADRNSRWGVAAFHYTDEVYRSLARNITGSADAVSQSTPTPRLKEEHHPRQLSTVGDVHILHEFRTLSPSRPTVIAIENLTEEEVRSGSNWLRESLDLDGAANLVFLNDPTLTSNDSIQIGWGLGTKGTPGIPAMLHLIHRVLGQDGSNRIYVGSGASGFIAAQLSIRDGAPAAILCNPDLGWFERKAPRAIVQRIYDNASEPGTDLTDIRAMPAGASPPSFEVFVNQSHPEQWNSQLRVIADLLEMNSSPIAKRTTKIHTFTNEKAPFATISTEKLQDSILAQLDRMILANQR